MSEGRNERLGTPREVARQTSTTSIPHESTTELSLDNKGEKVMGIGSTSAQTPIESYQESTDTTQHRGVDVSTIQGYISSYDGQLEKVRVHHKWRKAGKKAIRGTPHHSQLFVTSVYNNALFNFGLFQDAYGQVEFLEDQFYDPAKNPYHKSTTYKPNPIEVSPSDLLVAFNTTIIQCGPNYHLLKNNCQKFARLLMTTLGASHHRSLIHP